MKKRKLLDRIEALERRIAELEARPVVAPTWPVIPNTLPPLDPWFPQTTWIRTGDNTSDCLLRQ